MKLCVSGFRKKLRGKNRIWFNTEALNYVFLCYYLRKI